MILYLKKNQKLIIFVLLLKVKKNQEKMRTHGDLLQFIKDLEDFILTILKILIKEEKSFTISSKQFGKIFLNIKHH